MNTKNDHSNDHSSFLSTIAAVGAANQGAGSGLAAHLGCQASELGDPVAQQVAAPQERYGFWRQLAYLAGCVVAYFRLRRLAGRELPIPFHYAPEVFHETRRHQWLEAEKAGHDIWAHRDPHDPHAAAVRDWIAKHFERWRESRPVG